MDFCCLKNWKMPCCLKNHEVKNFQMYARWNHHKNFEHWAPLTFWVPDLFQAWNWNLIMKYEYSDQFYAIKKSPYLAKSSETTISNQNTP